MPQGIEYHLSAILSAKRSRGLNSQIAGWTAGVAGVANRMESLGQRVAGQSLATAVSLGRAAGMAGLLGGAYGMGMAVKSGVAFNAMLEQSQYAIGSTLQLMGHAGGDLATNLETAEVAMDRLFGIAAKSPASFDQAQVMFRNMMPGARAVTDSMAEILDLTKESLALGLIMGGDFASTGAQMSRILTGGAGAEFETWKVLQTPILKAGQAAGIFNDQMQIGSDLTQEFNKLRPDQRYDLVRAATKKLGVATEALGQTWTGVTSTISSAAQILRKELGQSAFQALKSRFKLWTGDGGLFDPEGRTMSELTLAAKFWGSQIGKAADYLAGRVESAVLFAADNWEVITLRLTRWADQAMRVAEMLLKFALLRAAVGKGMQLAGAAGGMAAGAASGVARLAPVVAKLGAWSLVAAPLVALLGAAALGVGVAFAGAAAYFIEHWDRIVEGFQTGTITLAPLLDVIDLLWVKLVAVGQVFFGTSDAAEGMQVGILAVVGAFESMFGILEFGLRAMHYVTVGWHTMMGGLKLVYLGFLKIMDILLAGVEMIAKIPGTEIEASSVAASRKSLGAHRKDVFASFAESAKAANSRVWADAADAFAAARVGTGEGVTAGLRENLMNWTPPTKKALKDALLGGSTSASDRKRPPGKTTHIHRLILQADLRDQDPDRVIGAFYSEIDRGVEKRTQSLANLDGGL